MLLCVLLFNKKVMMKQLYMINNIVTSAIDNDNDNE